MSALCADIPPSDSDSDSDSAGDSSHVHPRRGCWWPDIDHLIRVLIDRRRKDAASLSEGVVRLVGQVLGPPVLTLPRSSPPVVHASVAAGERNALAMMMLVMMMNDDGDDDADDEHHHHDDDLCSGAPSPSDFSLTTVWQAGADTL